MYVLVPFMITTVATTVAATVSATVTTPVSTTFGSTVTSTAAHATGVTTSDSTAVTTAIARTATGTTIPMGTAAILQGAPQYHSISMPTHNFHGLHESIWGTQQPRRLMLAL